MCNTFVVIGDVGEIVSDDSPQPSSGTPPAAHDAPIAQVDGPP